LFKVAAEATLTIAADSKHAIEAAARHPACTMLPKSSLPSSNRTPIMVWRWPARLDKALWTWWTTQKRRLHARSRMAPEITR
jgi:hypothetical protein